MPTAGLSSTLTDTKALDEAVQNVRAADVLWALRHNAGADALMVMWPPLGFGRGRLTERFMADVRAEDRRLTHAHEGAQAMAVGTGIAIAGVSAAVAVVGFVSPVAFVMIAPFAALAAILIWS